MQCGVADRVKRIGYGAINSSIAGQLTLLSSRPDGRPIRVLPQDERQTLALLFRTNVCDPSHF